jgi:hypothetical protein
MRTTRGLAKVGLTNKSSTFVILFSFCSSGRNTIWLLFVTSTLVTILGFGSRLTEYYFPTFAKPCSLAVRLTDSGVSIKLKTNSQLSIKTLLPALSGNKLKEQQFIKG